MIDAIHFCVLGPLFAVFVVGIVFVVGLVMGHVLAWIWEKLE